MMAQKNIMKNSAKVFEDWESQVRSYCRSMPTVFQAAKNAELWDEDGTRYIDFWSACGSLNYGHNHPKIKEAVSNYLQSDGVINSVDLHTTAKREFLDKFVTDVLLPRELDYVVQFTGPTGTNAVEAAIKLGRKITGRSQIAAFTGAFHGMTLGALSLTGNRSLRNNSLPLLNHVIRLPFDGYCGSGIHDLATFSETVRDPSGGIEAPAAIVVETVQGEGGLNVASIEWLKALADIAKDLKALLIVDEVQTGCGRTGSFFSFERAGIKPDIVCLSKSIGGIGLPFALVLINRQLDHWEPGEHNGTFRGCNLSFVSATAALNLWKTENLHDLIRSHVAEIEDWLYLVGSEHHMQTKGLGLMRGFTCADGKIAHDIAKRAFAEGVLVECCGPGNSIVKLMPPLTIEPETLREGLNKLKVAVDSATSQKRQEIRNSAKFPDYIRSISNHHIMEGTKKPPSASLAEGNKVVTIRAQNENKTNENIRALARMLLYLEQEAMDLELIEAMEKIQDAYKLLAGRFPDLIREFSYYSKQEKQYDQTDGPG